MKALIFCSLLGFVSIAQANYSGQIYEKGTKNLLFTFSNETTTEGDLEKVHNLVKDPQGNIMVDENSVLKGLQVVKVDLDHKQTSQKAVIEVKDGKVYFTKTKDGKSSTKEEKLDPNFVVTANFIKYVNAHWSDLMNGKTIKFRYGSWERQETVGFEIFKTEDTKYEGQEAVIIKMKPSAFLIAAIVDPIYFTYSKDGSKLLFKRGRVEPKKKVGDSFKDLDADMVYHY